MTGVCKECAADVIMDESTKIDKYEVWECPKCFYPNSMGDFWEIFDEREICSTSLKKEEK